MQTDADLLAYLGVEQWPCEELFQQLQDLLQFLWVLAQMHVQPYGSYEHSQHGSCKYCIIETVGIKGHMDGLVYPLEIQFVFVGSNLSLLILTSCPAFLPDDKLYWFIAISDQTPDTEDASSLALTILKT